LVVHRGEIWWAELGEPRGAEPAYRRPLLLVQADAFNRSRLRTVLAVVLTSNTRLLEAPGNVLLSSRHSGLSRDSVANVSQLVTLDRDFLVERVGAIPSDLLARVEDGLRLVLGLT